MFADFGAVNAVEKDAKDFSEIPSVMISVNRQTCNASDLIESGFSRKLNIETLIGS